MSDIRTYFNDGEDGVSEFLLACDDMLSAKFVLSEQKIARLLELIASSSILHRIIGKACAGFDFAAQFSSASIRVGQATTLLVPMNRSDQIAFAVNLLYSFDTGALNIRRFLEDYYYSGNGLNFAFTAFVRNIILPLRKNIEAAYRELIMTDLEQSNPQLTEKQIKEIRQTVYHLKQQLPLEDEVDMTAKEDMLRYLDGIQAAVDNGRTGIALNLQGELDRLVYTQNLSRYFLSGEAFLGDTLGSKN